MTEIPKQYETIKEWAKAMASGKETPTGDEARVLARYLDDAEIQAAIENKDIHEMYILDVLEAELDSRTNGKPCKSCRM